MVEFVEGKIEVLGIVTGSVLVAGVPSVVVIGGNEEVIVLNSAVEVIAEELA